MDAYKYKELRVYGKHKWEAHKLSGDGWEDCVHDAIVEIYEFGLPENEWLEVVDKHVDKEKRRILRRAKDTRSIYDKEDFPA